MKKAIAVMLLGVFSLVSESWGGVEADNRVVIYSGAEEYRNEYFMKRLKEQFPDYDISIEYMPTGNLAAKLAAEGTNTDMDIFYDLDFSYAGLVKQYLADLHHTISQSMSMIAKLKMPAILLQHVMAEQSF